MTQRPAKVIRATAWQFAAFLMLAVSSTALTWYFLLRLQKVQFAVSVVLGVVGGIVFTACFELVRGSDKKTAILIPGILVFPPILMLPLRALGYSPLGYLMGFIINLGYGLALVSFLKLASGAKSSG